MKDLDLHELLRYALSGALFMVALLIDYPSLRPAPTDTKGILELLGFTAMSLVAGSLIYVAHRSLAYPLIYKVVILLAMAVLCISRVKFPGPTFYKTILIFYWPSKTERDLDLERWRRRHDDPTFASWSNEWAAQIHFLYCAAWAVFLALAWGWAFHATLREHGKAVSFLVGIAAFVLGVLHQLRYILMEQTTKPTAAPAGGCN